MACGEVAAHGGDLGFGDAVEHACFQRGHLVPVAVEEFLAGWEQGDGQAAPVGLVAVAFD